MKEPNTWKFMHRIVWEDKNGPIPKGKILIFLDGNTDNCIIDNLALISRNEHMSMNSKKYRTSNPDATKLGLISVRLKNRLKEISKDEQK